MLVGFITRMHVHMGKPHGEALIGKQLHEVWLRVKNFYIETYDSLET